MKGTFGYDVDFIKKYKEVIVLKSKNALSQVLLVPDYQGRIMTSTANGEKGKSYGWVNYSQVESEKLSKQINIYGGEDRFWIGPEGGQYTVFFKKGDSFDFANWKTPALIDTESFDLVSKDLSSATFSKHAKLINYSETEFEFDIVRKVSILEKETIDSVLGISLDTSIKYVGIESTNKIINTANDWKKEKGLLSIWILGMLQPSDNTTIIIPFKEIANAEKFIRDDYFGKVPADRLKNINATLYFKGDGKQRGKIGLPPQITKNVAGSFDSKNNVLTIIQFNYNNDKEYVNSLWKIQDDPYNGDVINSYNDGPLESGGQLGPFYELETSSPAKELKKGESIEHIHRTFHFEGEIEQLNNIAKKVLGVDLEKVKTVF